MWQESIYTDERLKGKEKNVWKYHLKAAVAKLHSSDLGALIAIFKNITTYWLFCIGSNFLRIYEKNVRPWNNSGSFEYIA